MHRITCASLTRLIIQIKLENEYQSQKEIQQKEINDLKKDLESKTSSHEKLTKAVADLKTANEELQVLLFLLAEKRSILTSRLEYRICYLTIPSKRTEEAKLK